MIIPCPNPVFGRDYFASDIGFSAANDWLGKAIQYGGRREVKPGFPAVNHAFTVVGDGQIVEAQMEAGVVSTTLSTRTLDPNQKVYLCHTAPWSPDIGRAIASAAFSTIGWKYNDVLIAEQAAADSLAGHAINELFGFWPHVELDRMIRALMPHAVICSFDAAYALARSGAFPDCAGLRHPEAVDPQYLIVNGPFAPKILDVSFVKT